MNDPPTRSHFDDMLEVCYGPNYIWSVECSKMVDIGQGSVRNWPLRPTGRWLEFDHRNHNIAEQGVESTHGSDEQGRVTTMVRDATKG